MKKTEKPEKSAKSKIGFFDLPREVRDQVFHEVWKATPTLTAKYSSTKPPTPPAVTGKSSINTVQDLEPDNMETAPDGQSTVITQNDQPTITAQGRQPAITDTTPNHSSIITEATELNNSSAVSKTTQSNDISILPETSKLLPLKLTIHYDGGCACAQRLPTWLKTSRRFLKEGMEQIYRKGTWTWEPQYKAEFTAQHEKEKVAKAAKAIKMSEATVVYELPEVTSTAEMPAVPGASVEIPALSNEDKSTETPAMSESSKAKVTSDGKKQAGTEDNTHKKDDVSKKADDMKTKKSNGDDIEIEDFCFLTPSAAWNMTVKLGSLNYKNDTKNKVATIGIQKRKGKDLNVLIDTAAQGKNLKSLRVRFDHGQTRKLKRNHRWFVDLAEIGRFKSPYLKKVEFQIINAQRLRAERYVPGDPDLTQAERKAALTKPQLEAALKEAVPTPLENDLKREIYARGRSILGGDCNDEKGGVWCGNMKIWEEDYWQGSSWKFEFSKSEPMDTSV
jgi:hypothetical protein